MKASRMVAKTWGTWYTAEGERADGWTAEKAGGVAQGVSDTRVIVGDPKLTMGGAGEGLAGAFGGVRVGGGVLMGVL